MKENAKRASSEARTARSLAEARAEMQARHEAELEACRAETLRDVYEQQRIVYMVMLDSLAESRIGVFGERFYAAMRELDAIFLTMMESAEDNVGKRHMVHGRYVAAAKAAVAIEAQIRNLPPVRDADTMRFLCDLEFMNYVADKFGAEGPEYRVGLAYDAKDDILQLEMEAA